VTANTRKLSTRLIRKGALIEETYTAFREWDLSLTIRENIHEIRKGNLVGAKNVGWLHEILTTFSSRFTKTEDLEPLVILAKGNMDIALWKTCLLWHIGNVDELYYRFAVEWLFDQYKGGAYFLRTEDALPFVRKITDGRIASGGNLSDYGALRAARDLLRMAGDFGLLEGSVNKKFANFHIPQEAFVYVLQGLSGDGRNTSRIISSKSWRLFLMEADDVERELLRLHQYKILEYQVAGSIANLKLPCGSLPEYARKLVA
jgi:hypothetical protein